MLHYGSMSMISVSSSAIAAIGYNPFTGTLAIRFHSSATVYEFPNVPLSVFVGLMAAGSKGDYYNLHIRGKYR